ncbi:MAG: TolC family protein, partial [Crocinitomicaceae bacterium]|nr:TolC family protein [Crocinitomicaceae bacterium]
GLFLPELRVGTHGSYFGGVFSPLNPTGIINAALIWDIPLGRFIKKGSLKQYDAQLALQGIQMEQTKEQVNAEVLASRSKISTIKLQTQLAKEGSEFAEEALRQSVARQELRTVLPFEIVQAQEIYIKSKLDYLKSVASYNKAQYAYYVATGNNL